MSYKERLTDLDRTRERSLTEQLVDLITRGDRRAASWPPGEQLPPTRELAELAGVNHLTAVRAYRRLRELGLVSSQVGRGTFVRGAAAAAPAPAPSTRSRWQRYALPAARRDLRRPGARRDAPPGRPARGWSRSRSAIPSARLFPVAELREAIAADDARAARRSRSQYSDVQGLARAAPTSSPSSRRAAARPRTPTTSWSPTAPARAWRSRAGRSCERATRSPARTRASRR